MFAMQNIAFAPSDPIGFSFKSIVSILRLRRMFANNVAPSEAKRTEVKYVINFSTLSFVTQLTNEIVC